MNFLNNGQVVEFNYIENDITHSILFREGYNYFEYGDINQDNNVDVLDVVLIINYILEQENPSDTESIASDLNSDSIINILDVIILINIILN